MPLLFQQGYRQCSGCKPVATVRSSLKVSLLRESSGSAAERVVTSHAAAAQLDYGTGEGQGRKPENLNEAPSWMKLAVIALTSSLVALLEWALCRRPPLFWAPAFFLLSFILWRLGLREVGNSNVPPRSPDRLCMISITAFIFLWEYTAKRLIEYAPWISIAVAILLSPSLDSMNYREKYLSDETLQRAEREYLNRVPVTPKESAAWFGRLLTCFWGPYVEPMLLKATIVPLQEELEAAAPQGWTLALDTFSLGDVAPTLTGWQVFNNTHTGQVERVTADFSLDTSSLTMGLTGSSPFVGVFSELDVKLNVRGRFIGQQSIPMFAFLRERLIAALENELVEPNRGMVPLDYAPVVGEPLATKLAVKVVAVTGLTNADCGGQNDLDIQQPEHGALDKQDGVAIEISSPLSNLEDQAREMSKSIVSKVIARVPASRAGALQVHLSIPQLSLSRTSRLVSVDEKGEGLVEQDFDFQLAAVAACIDMRVVNEKGFKIGTGRIQVANLPDGSTGFWGTAPGAKPVATRWAVGSPAWKTQIELEGTQNGVVHLELSADVWQYSLDVSQPREFRRALSSVVAVQVLEARGLVSMDFDGFNDPYVMLAYNKRVATTRTVYNTLNPIFGDVVLFQENRNMLARKIRVDVLDRDRLSLKSDEACGWAYINLDLIAEEQITEQWLQLRGVRSGELRVRILVLPGTGDSAEVREDVVRKLEMSRVRYTSDVLKCTVVRAEGIRMADRRKLCQTDFSLIRQRTAWLRLVEAKKHCRWNEELRIRIEEAEDSPSGSVGLKVTLKEESAGIGLSGAAIGHATVVASYIINQLQKLRSESQTEKSVSQAAQKSNGIADDWLSAKAKQLQVASEESEGPASLRTDSVEVWVPLQGAGSDARLLLRLEGALGERHKLARGPLEETARLTQETFDKMRESGEVPATVVAKIQDAWKQVFSSVLD